MQASHDGFPARVFMFLISLLMLNASAAVHPAESDDRLSVIHFNIAPGGYPPYTIIHDGGQVSGIMWDVMEVLARRQNLTLEARQIPTKRVNGFLLSGHLDATMRAIEWTSKPERFVFTDSVVQAHDVIFSTTQNPLNAQTIDDLKGHTLLANLGYHHPVLKPLFDNGAIHRVDVHNTLEILKRLSAGDRFDGGIANARAGLWLIRQHGWEGAFQIEPVKLDETKYRLMFAPRWAPMIAAFNQTLADLRQSGELDAIINRYVP
ncbi:transporter substrate-binding domain-containing protein [Marinobacter halodurans]|uniref:Transporter substrate-binding domain-containing protein n=1 Tax=Marinobacter halodurans TaxID=2528979 RepID=A0ABY1ZGB0_9GAMM|nr:transporter substrate-binding domain-containing protein [Marinobacter halodurans]TBW50786.1 transporter substrate-binding domain-containing protein [Marinobacter halodurans]